MAFIDDGTNVTSETAYGLIPFNLWFTLVIMYDKPSGVLFVKRDCQTILQSTVGQMDITLPANAILGKVSNESKQINSEWSSCNELDLDNLL